MDLRVILLQLMDGMWFLRNEAPDNAAIWPLALGNKSLTHAQS